jgi:hypothetical protein
MSEELNYVEATPVIDEEKKSHGIRTLVWGILGLAMSSGGLLGLIFSIIGKNNANSFKEKYGELVATAKVGGILANIGLIVSIIMTVIWSLYFMIIVGLILSEF